MQRLFSTFPGGAPGAGLLLLRLALGGTLLAICVSSFTISDPAWRMLLSGVLAGLSAVALLIGFLTPFAALAGLGAIALTVERSPEAVASAVGGPLALSTLAGVAAATALLGPGAFSLDARLFGRRELSFPAAASRAREHRR